MNTPLSATLTRVAASPHAVGQDSVSSIMLKVIAALTPATLCGFWFFGLPAVLLWVLTCASALAGEAICLRLMGKPILATLRDGSALLTGWLLAMSLPPWAPWWLGVLGGLFATMIAKQLFGGLGCNLFNPAMVARVALLVSFPVLMTAWASPEAEPGLREGLGITFGAPVPDAYTSATLLGHAKTELARGADLFQAFSQGLPTSWQGERPGSLGETAVLLLALGGIALILMGVISWHIPLAMLLALAIPAAIGHALNPARYLDPTTHLLSGAAVLGAFFIATDYVTSPASRAGQLLFGAGCGFLTWVIRSYGGYPEGVAFAVLLMNALTPAIDRFIQPRIYGRDWRGNPRLQKKD
ncbi:MAG: electron transporter RnfD [Candidatus Dactylopiibacterium carminicum]|uniref:Ion-translocating oxidoreductase complex subunit D n=1 Tax=Candidatus Dactylopiibacterium carminicum TaxID=857335 RepID=A0A272EY48_9RHOO|nr:RnfABCDGE type electron transport complex subunit D [Candidatus Dactylopiibacterium carminicum]KAF7600426.1 electron transporter RnfD [Candidatus Dactylopiibacterium carminicum]PAS95047.1 MAG: electron transporter RnfD [Candidatus Dactylopiibacterium carminicum]PAS97844.1 MAG: electron transporter RnfD [Candidatus Dactylopiibacterium carminicum]PAT00425.1 MAG: electron transporter RnfD [Candidatus Dactylopiibacterium carminicum]